MAIDVRAEIDPASLRSLLLRIKAFSPALATATRKRLRAAGDDIVADVRAALMDYQPSSPSGKTTGLREGLAAGTRVSIKAGVAKQGISIETSPSRLAAPQKSMAKAWNRETFRHPVYRTGVWVDQKGRPYFGSVIEGKKEKMLLAVEEALNEALKGMEL